jgi:hypothetical protein
MNWSWRPEVITTDETIFNQKEIFTPANQKEKKAFSGGPDRLGYDQINSL